MSVARVDTCANELLEVIAPLGSSTLERTVKYGKNTVTDPAGRSVFTPEVIETGITALGELKRIALDYGAQDFVGVATAAFRGVDPQHARSVLRRFHDALGIAGFVITQDEEAEIGFRGAVAKSGGAVADVVVWDIGGSSMQISLWDEAASRVVAYKGHFANEAMHEYVIGTLQGRDYRTTTTPNPVLPSRSSAADPDPLTLAIRRAREAATGVPARIRSAVADSGADVIGIGGVHFYSNCEVLRRFSEGGCQYGRAELTAAITTAAHLTDAQLVAEGRSAEMDFAPYRVTGGALTVGFMRALGIDKVRTMRVNMCDGILVLPRYWTMTPSDRAR